MDISFCSFSVGHIEHIIQIFFENTSNIHEDARICLNISLSNGYEAYGLDKLDGQSGQTFGRMNNHGPHIHQCSTRNGLLRGRYHLTRSAL
jgi:hypothetical protein